MNLAVCSRYTGVVLASYCAITLTSQPPAYSAREQTWEKPPTYSLAIAPLVQSNSSEQFSLKDWLSENGSGGFPEGFSDENRRLDQWDTMPADTH